MKTLQAARERFVDAQTQAMQDGNDFQELMAIGMQELTDAIDMELKEIKQHLQRLER